MIKKSVSKDLKRIDRKQAERILQKIENELPEKGPACPELAGNFAGLRKLRIGDYRIIFAIIEDRIVVTRIRHRKDAYR